MNEPTIGESTTMDNGRLLKIAERVARMVSDGHLTIMRFTTNWRVGFGTPDGRDSIYFNMSVGRTFEEALRKAVAALGRRAVWPPTSHTPQLRAGYEVRLP